MKVKVISPFFDDNGIHKIGEVTEVNDSAFSPDRMEEVKEASESKKPASKKK